MSNPLLVKPREMWVEIFSGDFEPRKQELERLIDEALKDERETLAANRRFGTPAAAQSEPAAAQSETLDNLTREYDALLDQARTEGAVKLLVRAAGRNWRQVKDLHPPRPDNDIDENLGVNRSEFFEVAVKYCIVEPKFSDEDYADFVEFTPQASWDRVCSAAWAVNEGEVSIPKSSAVSLLRQMREEGSRSAESTGSTPELSMGNPPLSDTNTSDPTDS